MSKNTTIQWADSTINPVMGCSGCELFPKSTQLRLALFKALKEKGESVSNAEITSILKGLSPSEFYHRRKIIARELSHEGK